MEFFIRNTRLKSPLTPNLRRLIEDNVEELSLENGHELDRLISLMQNAIINTESDRDRVFSAMRQTFEIRRAWIRQQSPSIADIYERYHKFKEMPNLVTIFIIHIIFFFINVIYFLFFTNN